VRVGDLDERNHVYKITAVRNRDGRVVEFSGSIVLEPGERIISHSVGFRPIIWMRGRKIGTLGDSLLPTTEGMLTKFFPGDGWGTIYFTDRRILFLRKPALHHLAEIYNVSPYDIDASIPPNTLLRAAAVISGGGMEFLEIRYEDITRYECGISSADIRFNVLEHEYVLRLPRKVFEEISAVLITKGIAGKVRALTPRDIPFFWMAAASLECFVLLTWLSSDSNAQRRMWAMIGVLMPLLVLYLLSRTPRLRNVKRRQWGMSKGSRVKSILAFSIAAAILLPGSILTYYHESMTILVFVMAFVSIFAAAGLLFRRDWRTWSRFEEIVPRSYLCPNCGRIVTRNDVGCNHCGACVWWTCKVKLHRFRRKRIPGIFQ